MMPQVSIREPDDIVIKKFADNPSSFVERWSTGEHDPNRCSKDFQQCIKAAFNLSDDYDYVYRAQGETTLTIAQKAINGKRANGLHKWYEQDNGEPLYPAPEEIKAYTTLFDPSLSFPKAFNAYKSSTKPNSLKAHISTHLSSRFLKKTQGLLPSRKDRKHVNPYLDFWIYSCNELEWAGPWEKTVNTKASHHILPIFYHHFGCVVPSYAALYAIAKLAQPAKPSKEPVRPILDIGSGTGYWTYMLRNLQLDSGWKELDVHPVDNGTSEYRIMWVKDTVKVDGKSYLTRMGNGKGCVLLLVYPQARGDFTAPLLKMFEGDTVVVVGTQNGNGFTGFPDEIVDVWMEENRKEYELVLRLPVPSFAGKDEAMFVFQREKV